MNIPETLKLGKLPAKYDKRTIKLSSILRKKLLPELPKTYNLDVALGGIDDNRMFGNDKYGDCVIAARAHQTLRFEKYEQGIQPFISDEEVIDQYFDETGGLDSGLYLLLSLRQWRKEGWKVGGQTYTIYAFASVNWKKHNEVKHCIHLLGGVNFGMLVYQTDIDQFNASEDWHLTGNDGALQGGHGVYAYAYGYDDQGIVCMTWGKRQRMTWDFWDKRVDEAYGIVDNRDEWIEDSPVYIVKLDGYLAEITGEYDEEPSECPVARAYAGLGDMISRKLGRLSRFKTVIHRYRGGK